MAALGWRWGILVVAALLVGVGSPVSEAQDRNQDGQNADEAREAEDALEELLRRFGPEAAALKADIDSAINSGADFLLGKQADDGSYAIYDGYPLGGTALPALAIKKAMIGLYNGDERDIRREIRSLEREANRHGMTATIEHRLAYLRDEAPAEIERRATLQESVDRAIDYIREEYAELKAQGSMAFNNQNIWRFKTYGIGIVLMLLEAYYTPEPPPDADGDSVVAGPDPRRMRRDDLAWVREMVEWLVKIQIEPVYEGVTYEGRAWRYPTAVAATGSSVDMSVVQYAILGLKAASRMGVRVEDPDVYVDLCAYVLDVQQEDGPEVQRQFEGINGEGRHTTTPVGPRRRFYNDRARGWSYYPVLEDHGGPRGSVTTAALASLIISMSELYEMRILPRDRELQENLEQAVLDGLAWLSHNYSVTTNPGENGTGHGWHYYYLYGLERAGVLAQKEYIGDHPWYVEGARLLVQSQSDTGAWITAAADDDDSNLRDTAFAILFLKRATIPVNVPLRGGVVSSGDNDRHDDD